MKTIKIVDSGCDRYTISSDCYCLGRQWDNMAEQMKIIKPSSEENNVCTMIVSSSGVVIDHLDIRDDPKSITNVLSRYPVVQISFSFTNEDGYVKNSEIKEFYFASARKPEDFVPVEPEQTGKIDILLSKGYVDTILDGQTMNFYNANSEKVRSIDLSGIFKETDPTVPEWAKQPEKPTYSYDEIKNTPTIPSIDGLASEIYVDDKTNKALTESKDYTDTAIGNLINSAPETLDTLGEIASAIKENEDVIKALNGAIATKQDATDNLLTTTSKNIVGAINELNGKIGSANAQLQNILGV